ncbi:MAG: o-succinylbenzoate synthase [Planctomycetaceae bacterium]|nr:o-succinylbenzoate synthase [Planctomycetaceae bacterium]
MIDGGTEILRIALPIKPEAQALVGATEREIAFLRVVDESTGRVGFGECAPLAGLHREPLDEAIEALEAWSDGACDLDELPPSAAFAASTACAMLDGFGARTCAAAKVAAFFPGGLADLDERVVAAFADASCIKLKIGRADVATERALLQRAFDAWPSARFRLDGNRRMELDACVSLVRGLEPGRIEYLEEPLSDPSELVGLSRATGVPVALDELVVDGSPEAMRLRRALSPADGVVAWVLRMSAIGSLEAIRARADEAARLGVDVVLSTAYESSFSLRAAVQLAASLPNARRAHGIGTAALLAEDSCASARVVRGEIAGEPLPVPFAEAWS